MPDAPAGKEYSLLDVGRARRKMAIHSVRVLLETVASEGREGVGYYQVKEVI